MRERKWMALIGEWNTKVKRSGSHAPIRASLICHIGVKIPVLAVSDLNWLVKKKEKEKVSRSS